MTKPSSIPQVPVIPMLIPTESVQLAKQLAQQHPVSQQAEQTYHNLLAVLAVNHYFKMLAIPTDLSQCDCWNPFLRMTTNVADLEVVGYGRFECCPVAKQLTAQGSHADRPDPSTTVSVPADVQADRVGYIAVQVEGDLSHRQPKLHLLGFVDRVNGETFQLAEVRSLFELPHYLEQLNSEQLADHAKTQFSHLTHWLKHRVEEGWQTLDALLSFQRQAGYQVRTPNGVRSSEANRSRCMYGKTLSLDTANGEETILLITEVIDQGKATDEVAIELKICPIAPDASHGEETAFLPPGLEMVIVDVAGEAVMQAQARAGNRMMELGFHAEEGDRFQLQVQLNDTVVIESFLV